MMIPFGTMIRIQHEITRRKGVIQSCGRVYMNRREGCIHSCGRGLREEHGRLHRNRGLLRVFQLDFPRQIGKIVYSCFYEVPSGGHSEVG